MKLGIVSQSKLLTVFIRENMTKGLHSKVGDIKITHGKLWGHLVCLLESDSDQEFDNRDAVKLLPEHKIGQVLSLGYGRTFQPLLATGDVVVSSEALLCQCDFNKEPSFSPAIEASSKILDRVLNSYERYRSDEEVSRAIVGKVISSPVKLGLKELGVEDNGENNVLCWDKDGYYLAEYCSRSGIPWALVRILDNGEISQNKFSPALKWDMAKKCFWIVKGMLERSTAQNSNKRVR